MGKIKAPPLLKRMGTAVFGDVEFVLLFSRDKTLSRVKDKSMQDLLLAAASVAQDYTHHDVSGVTIEDATRIVQSAVQIEWYKAHGQEVPAKLETNLVSLIESARSRPASSSAGGGSRKKGTVMIKDVIIDGLLRHLPEDEIIATVHSQFPDARTGPRDLAYYRHKLRKSGHLPPPERRTRSSSRKENTMSDEQKVQEAPAERPTKTIDVLRKAKAEGLSIEDTAKALHEVMDGRDAADKVIKDVIILGILDGKSTDDVVKDVHETFANVASVNPKTGPKDIAYYRTRLRKEYGLEVPSNRATSSKTDVEEVQVGDLNEGGEGEEGEAKPTRKPRAKKAAAAEEAPEADAQA